jgi:hypothetical protein
MQSPVPALDSVLEELTSLLVELTQEGSSLSAVTVSAGDFYVQFAGAPAELLIEAVSNDYLPGEAHLNDYQLAVLYGLGFELDEEAEESNFLLEYELEDDETWEEQSLREFALQALGILHYVFAQDPGTVQVEGVR